MEGHVLGGTCALLAALAWAFAMILFKHGGEKVPPLALNLFKNAVGLVLLFPTLWVYQTLWVHQGEFQGFESYASSDIWILVLSGFLGITLADTLFFYSLNLVGVGLVSIVDCLYSPFIILFSWLILLERLTLLQYLGAGMILLAVYITSGHAPPKDRTRRQLILGIFLGVLNMALMAIGIVIAKPVIERTPLIESTIIRMAAGTVFLALIVMALPQRRALLSAFRPSRIWKVTIPGSVLGAYLALILWMAGFQMTDASVAGILNQTATIFALILAAVFLKEQFTRRKFVSVAMAMSGIVLVMLC